MRIRLNNRVLRAKLSTESAVSSYGMPVLVLETGEDIGTLEAKINGLEIIEATSEELEALKRAGYVV